MPPRSSCLWRELDLILLYLALEFYVMLLKINYHKCDVVETIVILVAFVSNLLSYFFQWETEASHLINFFGDLFFAINLVDSVGRQNQEIVFWLDLVVVSFRYGYQKLLVFHVANCSADGYTTIHSSDIVFHDDKSVISHNSVILIRSIWSLIISQFQSFSVLF